MKRLLLPLLLSVFSLPVYGYEYEPDLEAPDVTIYGELHAVRSDFDSFGGSDETGFRGRLGMEFNDTGLGRWRWRVEGGLNQFGETSFSNDLVQAGNFGSPGLVTSRVTRTSESIRLTGFEFGARLYDSELFYLRAGAYIYSMKHERDILIIDRDVNNAAVRSFPLTPESESNNGASPYVGAGIEFPLIDESFRVVAEYNLYRIEQEKFDNMALGAQFRF